MKIKNKITLYYTALGIGVGALSAFLSDAKLALLLAILLLYVSIKLVPRVFDLVENPLPDGSSTWELIKLGFLPYFLMWLIFWIMVYTLII